jgi:hypothetical protein
MIGTFFFVWRTAPFGFERFRDPAHSDTHTHTHTHTFYLYKYSRRRIGPSQTPLPDNTLHSQQKNIRAPGGIQIRNPSKREAEDSLGGRRNRQTIRMAVNKMGHIIRCKKPKSYILVTKELKGARVNAKIKYGRDQNHRY